MLENKETTIKLENLTNGIIRGVAGIGKSYTTEEIERLWKHGEIFQKIKYLFYFRCREINNWIIETIEKLIEKIIRKLRLKN